MTEAQRASCESLKKHLPHDWQWTQLEGGHRVFDYHCPGVKSILIETWED